MTCRKPFTHLNTLRNHTHLVLQAHFISHRQKHSRRHFVHMKSVFLQARFKTQSYNNRGDEWTALSDVGLRGLIQQLNVESFEQAAIEIHRLYFEHRLCSSGTRQIIPCWRHDMLLERVKSWILTHCLILKQARKMFSASMGFHSHLRWMVYSTVWQLQTNKWLPVSIHRNPAFWAEPS